MEITSDFLLKVFKNAVKLINTEIQQTILGFDATKQKEIDENLVELDGSQNKKRLGANSILAVSLACKSASNLLNIPFINI